MSDGECYDGDECAEISGVCSAHETCTNTVGSYTCDCIAGYQWNDVNSCAPVDVLVLSTYTSSDNIPLVMNSAADYRLVELMIHEEVQVYASCSLTWKNELYVFGGNEKKNQIAMIKPLGANWRRLELIGQLKFNHSFGDCVNVANNRVILCFNDFSSDWKRCRQATSPTGEFSKMTLSQYDHRKTRIATDNGEFESLVNL